MRVTRSVAVLSLVAVLSIAVPARALAGPHATDTAGTSHVQPTSGRQPAVRQSRVRSGWIGVGVNTAILIVKLAIPSLGRHPLSWT